MGMVRNIPCRFDKVGIEAVLWSAGFGGSYNFVHVPMNPSRTSNTGYFFICFPNMGTAQLCWQIFHGRPFCWSKSWKVCEVAFANQQRTRSSCLKYFAPPGLAPSRFVS